MQLGGGSFEEMASDIKTHSRKIVLFGVGVIGSSITPAILNNLGLINKVECCIDNDSLKWGKTIDLGENKVKIYSPDILDKLVANIAIFVNISRYAEALEQLEQMDCTKTMICYIMPMMCITNFHNYGGKGVLQTSKKPVIPKKIHYMWLGGGTLPKNLQMCVESWRKYCPDYEIIKWDESNYDVKKSVYMDQAYQYEKYGYVPDYARIDILYHHGGIYMDTDVEVIRNLDDMLYQEAFCSVEKWQVLNFGGCSGAIPKQPALKRFLQAWKQRRFINEEGSADILSSGFLDTRVAMDCGYVLNGQNQTILGMNIYTYDYFHPYDYMSGKMELTDDTYAIHHFNGGWLDEHAKLATQRTRSKYESLCHRIQQTNDLNL